MKTFIALYLWQAITVSQEVHMGWKKLDDFGSVQACERAVQSMNVKPNQWRCIDTGRYQ